MNDQFFMIFFVAVILFAPVGAYDNERVKNCYKLSNEACRSTVFVGYSWWVRESSSDILKQQVHSL